MSNDIEVEMTIEHYNNVGKILRSKEMGYFVYQTAKEKARACGEGYYAFPAKDKNGRKIAVVTTRNDKASLDNLENNTLKKVFNV